MERGTHVERAIPPRQVLLHPSAKGLFEWVPLKTYGIFLLSEHDKVLFPSLSIKNLSLLIIPIQNNKSSNLKFEILQAVQTCKLGPGPEYVHWA